AAAGNRSRRSGIRERDTPPSYVVTKDAFLVTTVAPPMSPVTCAVAHMVGTRGDRAPRTIPAAGPRWTPLPTRSPPSSGPHRGRADAVAPPADRLEPTGFIEDDPVGPAARTRRSETSVPLRRLVAVPHGHAGGVVGDDRVQPLLVEAPPVHRSGGDR